MGLSLRKTQTPPGADQPRRTAAHRCLRLCIFTLAWSLAACSAEPGHQPGAQPGTPLTARDPAILGSLLVSTTTPESSRQSADRLLVQAKGPRDETRLALLDQLLYAPGQSDAMRIYAMDQLAAADPARAGRSLALYLPRFSPPVLAHACRLAVTLADPRLVAPLIRSLAQTSPDSSLQNRPEWPALEKIAGTSADQACWQLLAQSNETAPRVAALDCLQRLHPAPSPASADPAILSRLAALPPRDPWLSDIQWWASAFHTLPSGTTESAWIQFLHKPDNAALVSRALEHHHLLTEMPPPGPSSDYHPAPQFIYALAYADPLTLSTSRPRLLEDLRRQLAAHPHMNSEPFSPGAADSADQTLDAQAAKLSRGDLLTLHLLLRALAHPAPIAELYRQGLADLSDTASEHGGLLSLQGLENPALVATLFPPLYAENDFQYLPDDKLLTQAPAGLALYHFHFQQINNQSRAGPDPGDLQFAAEKHAHCLVITSVGPRQINLDYYNPAGAIVHLGVFRVPN